MNRKTSDVGQSVRARLLALANQKGLQLEYVLLRYALERFLYRLGISPYADRFVLKGASAFAVWIGPFCRVTRDADLETFGTLTPEGLMASFQEICAIPCPLDGVVFDRSSFCAEAIKTGDKYPGLRLAFGAEIGGARVLLQFDVAEGDSIYPAAEFLDYPALLSSAAPRIRVYPRYTVVAEKFQVMVSRGILNSRLKDYHDVWVLTESFDFDGRMLREALERTFARRGTVLPETTPDGLGRAFSENPDKRTQWTALCRKFGLAGVEFREVVARLASFLEPILESGGEGLRWNPSSKSWKKTE